MYEIHGVTQGQANEGRVKSVARKGQREGGRMGQSWCGPSCLKEPQQASLYSPRGAFGCSSRLADGKRVLETLSCSHIGTSYMTLTSTHRNLPVVMAFPYLHSILLHPTLTLLKFCTHPTIHSPIFSLTHQIIQSSSFRTAPRATEHPRQLPAPIFQELTVKTTSMTTQWQQCCDKEGTGVRGALRRDCLTRPGGVGQRLGRAW